MRKREGVQQTVISWEFALCGRNLTPPGSLAPVLYWGGVDVEQDTLAELGRLVVAHCPSNANIIAQGCTGHK